MVSPVSSSCCDLASRQKADVELFLNERDELTATIDTERLHLRSVQPREEDYSAYAGLFGDAEVMKLYATGETKSRQEIQKRIDDVWVKRWHERDPYSGLAVCERDTNDFVGHVILGHGDQPGQSEMAYLSAQRHWHKGYGTEAIAAVLYDYSSTLIHKQYTLEGKPLETICATSHVQNRWSVKILESLGMHFIHEVEKFGGRRRLYELKVSQK
jgi:RimJ/RimL family protein N-acetyltransferase